MGEYALVPLGYTALAMKKIYEAMVNSGMYGPIYR
jgi:hypothetical protein